MTIFDFDAAARALEALVFLYEQSAPTVSRWADGLYRRLHGDEEGEVLLSEVRAVEELAGLGGALPNQAANVVFKLMRRLGQDTTGHAGF